MNAGNLKALVFDAYGTIYDVASVFKRCEHHFPGHGKAISELWRVKQLEYTWLRTLMGRYENFERLTEDGLRHTCRALSLELSDAVLRDLMSEYFKLATYSEVPAALERLAAKMPLAILSNGSPAMLQKVTEHNGLTDRFQAILSVDGLKIFKPSPRVYESAVNRLGIAKEAIGFVSSNYWDAVGAKAYGFYVLWINRFKRVQDELGVAPDQEVFTMNQIADWVEAGT